jgi:hypothetical protein
MPASEALNILNGSRLDSEPWIVPPRNAIPFDYIAPDFALVVNIETSIGSLDTRVDRYLRLSTFGFSVGTTTNLTPRLRFDGPGVQEFNNIWFPMNLFAASSGTLYYPIFAIVPPGSRLAFYVTPAVTLATDNAFRLLGWYLP